jgi:hypothetical protein
MLKPNSHSWKSYVSICWWTLITNIEMINLKGNLTEFIVVKITRTFNGTPKGKLIMIPKVDQMA